MDGKTLADQEMIIAPGVTIHGHKVPLGFVQAASENETYNDAKAALQALKPSLALMNVSALNSLEEGLEETLTLHRLGLMPQLKRSFRTTNGIESLNAMVAQRTRNVKRWNNSDQ